MKRLIITLISAIYIASGNTAFAQTANEIIASDINNAQWFSLERHMTEIPEDSLSTFMGLIGKAFTATKFNRPEASIEAFSELINNHSESLGLSNLLMMSHIMANDLSKLGYNSEAGDLITHILDATSQHLDSITVNSFNNIAKQYKAFSQYQLNKVVMPDNDTPRIEFAIDSIHTKAGSSCFMKLINSKLNEKPIEYTFDTGAGVNIISDSLANVYNIKNLDVPVSAQGVDDQDGWLGIADELRIGNIKIKNVPFYVITISSGNEEADQYAKHLHILLGMQIM